MPRIVAYIKEMLDEDKFGYEYNEKLPVRVQELNTAQLNGMYTFLSKTKKDATFNIWLDANAEIMEKIKPTLDARNREIARLQKLAADAQLQRDHLEEMKIVKKREAKKVRAKIADVARERAEREIKDLDQQHSSAERLRILKDSAIGDRKRLQHIAFGILWLAVGMAILAVAVKNDVVIAVGMFFVGIVATIIFWRAYVVGIIIPRYLDEDELERQIEAREEMLIQEAEDNLKRKEEEFNERQIKEALERKKYRQFRKEKEAMEKAQLEKKKQEEADALKAILQKQRDTLEELQVAGTRLRMECGKNVDDCEENDLINHDLVARLSSLSMTGIKYPKELQPMGVMAVIELISTGRTRIITETVPVTQVTKKGEFWTIEKFKAYCGEADDVEGVVEFALKHMHSFHDDFEKVNNSGVDMHVVKGVHIAKVTFFGVHRRPRQIGLEHFPMGSAILESSDFWGKGSEFNSEGIASIAKGVTEPAGQSGGFAASPGIPGTLILKLSKKTKPLQKTGPRDEALNDAENKTNADVVVKNEQLLFRKITLSELVWPRSALTTDRTTDSIMDSTVAEAARINTQAENLKIKLRLTVSPGKWCYHSKSLLVLPLRSTADPVTLNAPSNTTANTDSFIPIAEGKNPAKESSHQIAGVSSQPINGSSYEFLFSNCSLAISTNQTLTVSVLYCSADGPSPPASPSAKDIDQCNSFAGGEDEDDDDYEGERDIESGLAKGVSSPETVPKSTVAAAGGGADQATRRAAKTGKYELLCSYACTGHDFIYSAEQLGRGTDDISMLMASDPKGSARGTPRQGHSKADPVPWGDRGDPLSVRSALPKEKCLLEGVLLSEMFQPVGRISLGWGSCGEALDITDLSNFEDGLNAPGDIVAAQAAATQKAVEDFTGLSIQQDNACVDNQDEGQDGR